MKTKTTGLILLAFLLILPILACADDSGSSGGPSSRVGSGELLNPLPKYVSRIQVAAADEITGGSVPESMTGLFEGTWKDYSLGGDDEIVTVDDVDQVVRALSSDGGIVMLGGSRIDFAAIGQWLADEDTNIGKRRTRAKKCGVETAPPWFSCRATATWCSAIPMRSRSF